MKIANLIITIISSVLMTSLDCLFLGISFVSAILGLALLGSSSFDQEAAVLAFIMFALTLFIAAIGVTSLIMGIIAFAKKKKPSAYTKLYIVICSMTGFANILIFPVVAIMTKLNPDGDAFFVWPAFGLVLTTIMTVLTIISAATGKKQAA